MFTTYATATASAPSSESDPEPATVPLPLTVGQAAARFGLKAGHVRRLYQRGLLPEPARVGAYRVVAIEDLPKVEEALRKAGYLKIKTRPKRGPGS